MGVLYRAKRDYASHWGEPASRDDTLEYVRQNGKLAGGPFRLRERKEPWGPERSMTELLIKLKPKLTKGDVGDVWLIDTAKLWGLNIRKVETQPRIPDSPGTAPMDIVRFHLYTAFPRLESWGICNCRRVAGSSSWSQHAYCNAEDVHAAFNVMEDATTWLVRQAQSGLNLPVAQAIFNRRVWEPSRGWREYSGVSSHTDHIHISGSPMREGLPDCA